MWGLNSKESSVLKNWCFRTAVLEKTLESPLDCKEIKPVNPKENQPLIFVGRTEAEAETPRLWPSDVKSRLTGKDLDAGKYWGQEEKEVVDDEIIGWHHWLNGYGFEQTLVDSEEQGSLVCCSPWCRKESNRTEWLNNNLYRLMDSCLIQLVIRHCYYLFSFLFWLSLHLILFLQLYWDVFDM